MQEHFNPHESQQPSGPLYGVQFSQLTCSDVNRNLTHGSVGPKRSPLGLVRRSRAACRSTRTAPSWAASASRPNGLYGIDRDISDIDHDAEELIAVAGSIGFAAPADLRADRITADGRTLPLRRLRVARVRTPRSRRRSHAIAGRTARRRRATRPARSAPAPRSARAASGMRADTGALAARRRATSWSTPPNANRFPPRATRRRPAHAPPTCETILGEALTIANRARAQIRRPLGSAGAGHHHGRRHRTATSSGSCARATPRCSASTSRCRRRAPRCSSRIPHGRGAARARRPRRYLVPRRRRLRSRSRRTCHAMRDVPRRPGRAHGRPWRGARARSATCTGRTYPDGIEGTPRRARSPSRSRAWSPFNVGLQLDLVYNQLVTASSATSRRAARARFAVRTAGRPTRHLARAQRHPDLSGRRADLSRRAARRARSASPATASTRTT